MKLDSSLKPGHRFLSSEIQIAKTERKVFQCPKGHISQPRNLIDIKTLLCSSMNILMLSST